MELLVVMTVIGLLTALLFPVLSKAKDFARATSCRNRLRQMGMALQMYAHDEKSSYPHYLGPAGSAYGDTAGQGGRATGLIYWSSKLRPYGSLAWTNRTFHCPGYAAAISGPWLRDSVDRLGSYAYNTHGVRTANSTRGAFGLGPIQYWQRAPRVYVKAVSESQVVAPSEMLAMGDSFMKVGAKGGSDVWGCVNILGSPLLEAPYVARHGRKDNQVYVDGHVSANNPGDLYDPIKAASMWNYDHQPHEELWGQ